MSFSLLPRFQADAVTDIPISALKEMGVRLVMLDFDNTLVPYTADEGTEQALYWLRQLREEHFEICLVSNSKKMRVKHFGVCHGIDFITHSRKPFSDGISRCLKKFKMRPEQCVLIGDQIYTDVLGANCAGVTSILVKAIDNHNIWLKLRNIAELPFRYIAKNRRFPK